MPTGPEYAAPERSTEPSQPDAVVEADPNDRLRDAVDAVTGHTEPDHDHDHGDDRDHGDEGDQDERRSLPTFLTPIEDPEATYDYALAAKITAGAHIMATTTAQWIRLIAEFDERGGALSYFGINSTAHFLSVYCSTGTSTAREHVRVARSLALMPLLGAAFDAGRLSYSKVRECARIAGQVDERVLLEYAEALSAAQLEASIRTFRRTRRDRLQAEQLRTASWSTSHDGTITLRAVLPAEDGARVVAALEKALDYLNSPTHAADVRGEQARQNPPTGAPDGAADDRCAPAGTPSTTDPESQTRSESESDSDTRSEPLAFTRADALLEVAASYLDHAPRDHSGADRDLVVVHVGASVLATPLPTSPDSHAPTGAQPDQSVPAGAEPDDSVPAGAEPDDSVPAGALSDSNAPAGAQPDDSVPAGAQPDDSVPAGAEPDDSVPAGALSDSNAPAGALPGSALQVTDPQVCAIGGVGSVSPATAQRLACDAMIQTITYNTDGHVLNLGRAKRFVTKAQRRALTARDGCCQFPGCGRTRNLDAHHIVHWAFGGASDLSNYVLLCTHHHTLVHEGSLTITKTPLRELGTAAWVAGDRWTFTRIGGQRITAEQTTRTIAYDVENETRYGERALLADLIADVTDMEHPYADAIRPTWGGEAGGGRTAADALLDNAEHLDLQQSDVVAVA